MKKLILFATAAITFSVLFISCSKKDSTDTSKPSSTSSSWSIDGQDFKGTTSVFDNDNNSIISSDQPVNNTQDAIIVALGAATAGTYNATGGVSQLSTKQCSIQVTTKNGAIWFSSGGGTVNTTISGGKITATFSGVPMTNVSGTSTTVSGTIIAQQ